MAKPRPKNLEAVVREFMRVVEAAGGIIRDEQGFACPVGDPDWIDLGDCYVEACWALGRQPVERPGFIDDEGMRE